MCISSVNTNLLLSNKYKTQDYFATEKISDKQKTYTNNFLGNYYTSLMFLNNKNINFKWFESKQNRLTLNNFTYDISHIDENIVPTISITISARNDFPMKLGSKGLYLLALNDSICEKQNDKNIEALSYSLNTDKRTLELTCPIEGVGKALDIIKSSFVNNNITAQQLENAKRIASTGLFLSRRTGDFKDVFDDIPQNMTEEEYEKLIQKFTIEDMKNLNSNFISNSDIELNITLNKKDYEKYKDNITKYIDESWLRRM